MCDSADQTVKLRAANFFSHLFSMGIAGGALFFLGAVLWVGATATKVGQPKPEAMLLMLPVGLICMKTLRDGMVWSFALFEATEEGLQGRLLWMRESVSWTDICRMRPSEGRYVHLNIGGRYLDLRIPGGAEDGDCYSRLHRAWRRGVTGSGRRNVPLYLRSFLPAGAWTAVVLLGASAVTAVWLRGDADWWVAALLTAIGMGGLLRGWRISSEKIVLSREGIVRTRLLSHQFIPWGDIDLLGTGFFQDMPPWHGRVRIESRRGAFRFSTKLPLIWPIARYLHLVCLHSFRLDLASGEFLPPQSTDRLLNIQRVTEMASRLHRRYLLTGIAQLMLLPLVALGWFAALAAGFLFKNCDPVTWYDVAASFRRARQIRACIEEFQALEAGIGSFVGGRGLPFGFVRTTAKAEKF